MSGPHDLLAPAQTAPAIPARVALGFSPAAIPVLLQLQQSGLVGAIRWPTAVAGDLPADAAASEGANGPSPEAEGHAAAWLSRQWPQVSAVLAVGACGLVTRLIAPLLQDKSRDPAVLVIDPLGRFVIPLLGGHAAGGDRLAEEVAALFGAQTVLSGSSSARGQLSLDAFGEAWGWRRGGGDWTALMQELASGRQPSLSQENGLEIWRDLPAAQSLISLPPGETSLVISPRLGPGCRWHPPCLWLGIGCERDSTLSLLERLVEEGLAAAGLAPGAVAGLASIDRKGDETALLDLAAQRGWPLRLFRAPELAAVPVPHPSERVAREMGTPSVAEAAALLAADTEGRRDGARPELLLAKTIGRALEGERGAATLAIAGSPHQWAPQRGELHLVGSGPGRLDLLSGEARQALARTTVWVGYSLYLDLLEPLRRPDQLRCDGRLTEERARCAEALALAQAGLKVALVSSGDSGIYGMAGLALELWLQQGSHDRPRFAVHPGLSALQLAAARAGAPLMHDFCTISLSDRLTPWAVIEKRLRGAAAGDFVVALYNPRSRGRDWQLQRAVELLLEGRPAETPVALARQLGRSEERVNLHTLGTLPIEQVDMLTLVLIGNSSSYVRDGRMVPPRGYPGAELA
ncbi:MAG: precorrin-3B C(17)-methyltransferase [Cyanobium sp.]